MEGERAMTLAIRLVLALAAIVYPWPSTPWFPYAPGKPRPLMALTTFITSSWADSLTTANAGFPSTANLDNGSLGSSGSTSWKVGTQTGEYAGLGKYLYWDGIAAATEPNTVLVEDGDIYAYLNTNGRAVRMVYTLMFTQGTGSADFRSALTGGTLTGANPDVRWNLAQAGAYVGSTGDGYDVAASGEHVVLNFVDATNSPLRLPSNKLKVPIDRPFRLEWFMWRTAVDDCGYAILVDGRVAMKADGIAYADMAAEANRANEIEWTNVGNGSDETYLEIRLFGDYSGIEQFASGGVGNLHGTEDDELPRLSDNRNFGGSAFGAEAYDGCWTYTLTNATLDLSQGHDVFVNTRGYNAYPFRLDTDADPVSNPLSGYIETRESGMNWPTRGGRCCLHMLVRPSNAATSAVGFKVEALDGSDNTLVGVGWLSTAGGSADLLIYYDGGAEDTGINLDIDRTYVIRLHLTGGAVGVEVVDYSETNSTNRFVYGHESALVSGVPADGFKLRGTFESSNLIAVAGQFQLFDVGVYARVPVYSQGSYGTNGGTTISSGSDDDGTFRRAENVGSAAPDVAGPGGTIANVDVIGNLHPTTGLIRPGSGTPGYQFGMSGLSVGELIEYGMGDDVTGWAAAAKALQLINPDGMVNEVGSWAAEKIRQEEMRAALQSNGIEWMIGETAPPEVNGVQWTTALNNTAINEINPYKVAIPGPRYAFSLVDENGDVATATALYHDTAADALHPTDDYQWHRDMFGSTLRLIPGGTRKRDRTRER
jgi:hypothetical protein